eukprot:CAMPEP_0179266424 /NCGR_PEP_ID=MMETSP0797-20121207/29410_1 /TAXON_ID=47934 /ORGANISM="Dinophysis acuminata, Strain DAEP01" /LENGTH=540 /DNA_ID=CAMNT_0020974659 /DNA_START=1 /DNA_END=1619 /DNA_ORIENTATION=-
MVIEVVKPSVMRTAKLQTAYEDLLARVGKHGEMLQSLTAGMEELKEASELVRMFKAQIAEFNDAKRQFEAEIAQYQKDTLKRIEVAEMSCEQQKACCSRLSRSVDRVTDDMKAFDEDIKHIRQAVLDDLRSSREHMNQEIRRVDQSIKDADDLRQRLCDEVWGEVEPDDSSPPSFRRFDMQLRRSQAQLGQALEDLAALRRLDLEMVEVHEHRAALDAQLKAQRDAHDDLRQRVDKVADGVKQDSKQAANMMAAFTANLVQDIRGNFNVEVKAIRDAHKEMDDFVRQTLDSISTIDETCTTTGKQLEAALREMRLDLESIESRRRRDKQGVHEMVSRLEGSVVHAAESSQATLRGLEHVSNVISLSLQSERMSIALDVQDFVERKDTPYVGVRHAKLTKSSRPARGTGLDPELLVRLVYQPHPVTFQGASVERPQLLALREKLVHAAAGGAAEGAGHAAPEGGAPLQAAPQRRRHAGLADDRGHRAAPGAQRPRRLGRPVLLARRPGWGGPPAHDAVQELRQPPRVARAAVGARQPRARG